SASNRQLATMAARSMVRTGRSSPREASPIRHAIVAHEIVELRQHSLEPELDRSDRAVTLLGDVDLRLVMRGLATLDPVVVALAEGVARLVFALLGFAALQVVLVAVDEHDHIGVLLD